MTYEQGIEISDKLLAQLQKTNQINPKDSTEFNILHDALVTYQSDLETELRRQNLIKQYNEFGQSRR